MARYTVHLRQTAPSDGVSVRNASADLDDSYESGMFIDGSPYVVMPESAGLTVNSKSPAWSTDHHGAMVDPTVIDGGGNPVQGFDSRVNGTSGNGPGMQVPPNFQEFYQNSARAAFPLDVQTSVDGVKSLVLAKCAASVELGGQSNAGDEIEVVTFLANAPKRPTFRPPFARTSFGKPLYTRRDVRYSLLPRLDPTGVGSVPDWTQAKYLRRPCVDLGGTVWGRTIWPTASGDKYPAYHAADIGDVLLGMMLDIDEADDLADRVVQYGLDMYAIACAGTTGFIANGGYGWGRLVPIVIAGMLLSNADMMAAATLTTSYNDYTVPAFGEVGHTFLGGSDDDYPGGKPLWGRPHSMSELPYGNHDMRDLTSAVDAHEVEGPTGTVASGSSTTAIVLASSFSAVDDYYNGYVLRIGSQYRLISDYVGSTRTATVSSAFSGAPSNGTACAIRLGGTYQEMTNFVAGHALALRLFGAVATFGHDSFPDFLDRWVRENGILRNLTDGLLSPTWADPARPYGTAFCKSMWQTFRPSVHP